MDSFRANALSGDITEVPGIGKAAAARLQEEGIHNTYQLLGHYMKLSEVATSEEDGEPSIDTYMLNQQFWHFLKGAQITAHRSAIVKAVSDKVAASFRLSTMPTSTMMKNRVFQFAWVGFHD